MFNISQMIVSEIIDKAREININNDIYMPGDPGSTEDETEEQAILAEDEVDLTSSELKDAINDLEPDQQKELIALFFIGRGDYDKDEWHQALKEADNISAHQRARFLISKPMLADLLEEGLARFDISSNDLEG